MRRLDPWAALLLGGFLAMGVVILLATPGPWHRVVGPAPPVQLAQPAPGDVAVYVLGGRESHCTGVLWLHLGEGGSSLTAIVIAPKAVGFAPGDGLAPLSDIVDAAGPQVATQALGQQLGVEIDAWVTLDRRALRKAIEAMFPMGEVRAARARYRAARAAWQGRGGAAKAWLSQYESLREALPRVSYDRLGVVAFSNYVLGFGFVQSDLTLQGVASLGEALRDLAPGAVDVRAGDVVVERCRGAEVWHLDQSRLESLRLSLAFGLTPSRGGAHVTVRSRRARVLVVAPMRRSLAEIYADEVRRSLRRSAGAPLEVTLVSGTDDRLAFRAARAMDEKETLAVLVGPAVTEEQAQAAATRTYAMLRRRRQEAVVSGPLPAAQEPSPEPVVNTTAPAARSQFPVSWLPAGVSASTTAAALRRAARATTETFVRACWPGVLAPDLVSTELGLSFIIARHTAVGVSTLTEEAAARLIERLRLWGYRGERLDEDTAGLPPVAAGTMVLYRSGYHKAAVSLAADLGLGAQALVKDDKASRALVVFGSD